MVEKVRLFIFLLIIPFFLFSFSKPQVFFVGLVGLWAIYDVRRFSIQFLFLFSKPTQQRFWGSQSRYYYRKHKFKQGFSPVRSFLAGRIWSRWPMRFESFLAGFDPTREVSGTYLLTRPDSNRDMVGNLLTRPAEWVIDYPWNVLKLTRTNNLAA